MLERSYFGVDHCEVGRWIALSGNFAPWMVEVVEHHHDPSKSVEDATLVAIVAAADRCDQTPAAFDLREDSERQACAEAYPEPYGDLLYGMRPQRLLEENGAAQSQFLENPRLCTPFPRFGLC